MTWKAPSGNVYNLCLLDTNVISEILKYPTNEGKGFIEKFPPSNFAPSFTIYNIIELRRNKDVYNKFLDFFSVYPCFLLKPYQLIQNEELDNYDNDENISALLNSFSSNGKSNSYDLGLFINNLFESEEMKQIENNWRKNEKDILDAWLSNKSNFTTTREFPNSKDAEKYIQETGLKTIFGLFPSWKNKIIKSGKVLDINNFPSIMVMLYSQYYRLYDKSWKQSPQEVTDVSIISVAPYVDVIITEKFQANIFNKIKNKIKLLNNIEVYRLKDIRINNY